LNVSTPSRRSSIGLIARVLFVGAALVFGAWSLRNDWPEFLAALSSVQAWRWAFATLLVLSGLVVTGFVWLKLLSQLGYRTPTNAGLYIFFVGQLGKYIPGSVWSLGVQAEMARKENVPPRTTVANGLIFLYWNVTTAVILGYLALQFQWIQLDTSPLITLAIGLVAAVAITPRVTNFVTKRLVGKTQHHNARISHSIEVLALMTAVWFVYGIAVFVLVPDSYQANFSVLLASVGAFCIAYAAGVVIIVAPAGLGVREGVITFLLSPYLGLTNAIAVAVVTRVIHTLSDFSMAGISWIWYRSLDSSDRRNGGYYLAASKAVGWSIDRIADAALVNSVLNMAAASRPTTPKTIIHADHGAQGGFNWAFTSNVRNYGLKLSLGTFGDCYDCQSVLVGLLVDSEDLTSAA